MKHVVMYSGGKASWAVSAWAVNKYGPDNVWCLFTDVRGEDPDTYRFVVEGAASIYGITLPDGWPEQDLRQVAADHLPRLIWLIEGRTIWEVFKDDRFLGNSRLANCSKYLKQKPAREWLDANCDPAETAVYVGIDWTESHRLEAVVRAYQPYTAKAPLCEPPYTHKDEITAELRRRGIRQPRLYELGAAHNNCAGGCVRAGQGQFAWLLEQMPERFAEWERNEQDLREHLGKDVSILRDRTGGKVVPLTLTSFRERAESKPEQIDLFDIGGCGCFVSEESA